MSRRDLPLLLLVLMMAFAVGVALSSHITPCPKPFNVEQVRDD